jgi:Tfp pilus assembly protein PilE
MSIRSNANHPERSQAGFGLLETLAGLVVFMILAVAGTKAFKGVIANQRETAQVKALTDAVTVTAERLSAQSVAALTEPGSAYLQWSEAEKIGSGEYWFRFRTVPHPSVSGVVDTAVVGLEVEVGAMAGGVFTMGRSFATLIAPHLSSKDKLGQVSTEMERNAEASFYAGLQARIKLVADASKPDNQVKLNSFNCYDQEQCCGFMNKFFADPGIRPNDGIDEKCLYRCALGGAVTMASWNGACGKNFCDVAPWKTKENCCAAIAAGECPVGSVCAQVCIECVGEDGTTCKPPNCDGGWFNDFVDCANGKMCDGSPIPDGDVPGFGHFKDLCRNDECAQIQSECQARVPTCCREYWGVINNGGTPQPAAELCATISKQSECCDLPVEVWDWDKIHCNTNGKTVSAHNKIDDKWYCGFGGGDWDKVCAQTKGCAVTFTPEGAGGVGPSCATFPGMDSPWKPTYPKPEPPKVIVTETEAKPKPTTGGGPKTSIEGKTPDRVPTIRGGSIWKNWGGRE